MYNNILIISDNLHLSMRFEFIIRELSLENNNWSFGISPFSELELFSKNVNYNIDIYDLRKSDTIVEIIKKYDLVISLHCKQLFPPILVNGIKCINVHPGYNPLNRGWYPQVFSIIHDLPIGATIHEIDEQLDHGNIIARELVEKKQSDTSLTLYNKVLDLEEKLIKLNLKNILNNNYTTITPEVGGRLFLKRDFNALCKLDLNERTTVRDVLNRLRALSHGKYNNAYFIDPETNEKIYISIKLERENNI